MLEVCPVTKEASDLWRLVSQKGELKFEALRTAVPPLSACPKAVITVAISPRNKQPDIATSSFLLLVVMPLLQVVMSLLLVTMPLLLVASCS